MSDVPPPSLPPATSHGSAKPRYCLRCRTLLRDDPLGEEAPSCPRCGLPYAPDKSETYTDRPMPMRWRFWLPGLVVAIFAGVLAYRTIAGNDRMGLALFLMVPFAVGAILGFTTRVSFWLTLMLSALAVACIAFMLVAMNVSGIFCGLTLGGILLVPALVGALIGTMLRYASGRGAWDRRRYVVLTVLLISPYGADRLESRWPFGVEIAAVCTGATFSGPPQEAWDSILFYEQVDHEPPWLLTLALPRPVRAEGRKSAVGDVQRCIYQKGYLVKTITRRDERRLLAFDVSEQHLHFERDVTLLDGSFLLDPIDDHHTRVLLTTRYRRHLRPAWLWEPMEQKIIHTLHEFVLDGMQRHMNTGRG